MLYLSIIICYINNDSIVVLDRALLLLTKTGSTAGPPLKLCRNNIEFLLSRPFPCFIVLLFGYQEHFLLHGSLFTRNSSFIVSWSLLCGVPHIASRGSPCLIEISPWTEIQTQPCLGFPLKKTYLPNNEKSGDMTSYIPRDIWAWNFRNYA